MIGKRTISLWDRSFYSWIPEASITFIIVYIILSSIKQKMIFPVYNLKEEGVITRIY